MILLKPLVYHVICIINFLQKMAATESEDDQKKKYSRVKFCLKKVDNKVCLYCKETFAQKSNRDRHIKRIHQNAVPNFFTGRCN